MYIWNMHKWICLFYERKKSCLYIRVTRKVDGNLSNRLKVVFTSRHWVIYSHNICVMFDVGGSGGVWEFLSHFFYHFCFVSFCYTQKKNILDLYALCDDIFLFCTNTMRKGHFWDGREKMLNSTWIKCLNWDLSWIKQNR